MPNTVATKGYTEVVKYKPRITYTPFKILRGRCIKIQFIQEITHEENIHHSIREFT